MNKTKEILETIAEEVEAEYKMSGLSSGLYFDFAKDVAIRYADWKIKEFKEVVRKEFYDFNDKEQDFQCNQRVLKLRNDILSNKDKK